MNKIFVCVMSAILSLTACSKNDDNSSQVEVTNDLKEVNPEPQTPQQNSALSEEKIPEKPDTKEPDCESSHEAYQSCLAQWRSDVAMNGLPKEFYGNWGFNRNKDQCFFDGGGVQISKELFETYAYLNKDSMGWNGECKILDVERETSIGHMKLSLECLKDHANSLGNYKRNLSLIIVNENLEISEDSDNPNLGVQTLYRCSEIVDPND